MNKIKDKSCKISEITLHHLLLTNSDFSFLNDTTTTSDHRVWKKKLFSYHRLVLFPYLYFILVITDCGVIRWGLGPTNYISYLDHKRRYRPHLFMPDIFSSTIYFVYLQRRQVSNSHTL